MHIDREKPDQADRYVNKKDEANFKSLNVNQFAMYFEKNFITPIRNNKAEYLYYDNKEIDDAYQTK